MAELKFGWLIFNLLVRGVLFYLLLIDRLIIDYDHIAFNHVRQKVRLFIGNDFSRFDEFVINCLINSDFLGCPSDLMGILTFRWNIFSDFF